MKRQGRRKSYASNYRSGLSPVVQDFVASWHNGDESFEIGKAEFCGMKDITLVVSGTLLPAVIEAAERLALAGIDAAILEYPTIKPFDTETLVSFAKKTRMVITVEEHSIIGGLGGAVSEALSENCPVRLKRIGLQDTFGESGPYNSLLGKHGLTSARIESEVMRLLSVNQLSDG